MKMPIRTRHHPLNRQITSVSKWQWCKWCCCEYDELLMVRWMSITADWSTGVFIVMAIHYNITAFWLDRRGPALQTQKSVTEWVSEWVSDWLTEWWSYRIGWLTVGVSSLVIALSKWRGGEQFCVYLFWGRCQRFNVTLYSAVVVHVLLFMFV